MKPKREKWAMPEWMKPYEDFIGNTGGNDVAELIGRLDEQGIAFSNQIVFTMAVSVEEQVKLLARLRNAGKLK